MPVTPRNILFITTDQMRFDALGCNGGSIARTPNIDQLANNGINYQRAHNQNVVCMPARATIMTGQHVASHGVWMNGVCLPEDEPTIAHHLQAHGYQTGLLGKAHFEPWLGAPENFFENRMAALGSTGPHRGFDHMELANHFFEGHSHYDAWMQSHQTDKDQFYPMVTNRGQNTASRGETGALQVWPMDVPTELYHTHWVADRTINWLSGLNQNPFFCWMSFPDPHHPWDIPRSELYRHDWRDMPLPRLYRDTHEARLALLDQKPKHWRGYYEGTIWSNLESPRDFVPASLTPDQIREINAYTHIENELIDDAVGRVVAWLTTNNLIDQTDIFFTTDHGELQGDFGLMFKGPYHVDALMRLPMIWQPAKNANLTPATIQAPVGHVDLAKTFCQIAGIAPPDYCEGASMPTTNDEANAQDRQFQLTEWDSEHGPIDMHLKSLCHKDGWLITCYEPSHLYDGSEGELYNLTDDPDQIANLWDHPKHRETQQELKNLLYESLPEPRSPKLARVAPV
ncbi:MAG TPA: sulfatase [Gammaproteobacteria bacterium]|nr:sulfatase-like hydrolase/transferase [Pseudomonadales bacterium]MDC3343465.1 sulfatase-like hydrolase/transferase [Pseudomonadales bacterium]HAJ30259.1 sulfatase [Gammaproteobacteria bacterium]